MPIANVYETYNFNIADKSKEVLITVEISDGHPYEARIYSFTNKLKKFSEIPPSEANIGKHNSAISKRSLKVTVVTPASGTNCTMTTIIDGAPQTPSMEGVVSDDGIVFHATIKFS